MAKKIPIIFSRRFFYLAALVVAIAIFFQFHLGPWRETLYYDGDNITLALVLKSIFDGEPFHWVFSSQSFIFPEGPLYLIGFLITQSYRWALLCSAFLNWILLLLGVFLIAQHQSQLRGKPLAVLTIFSSLVLSVLCLEIQPDVNRNTIFSLIFLQTYYGGVVLVTLFQLGILSVWCMEKRVSKKMGLEFLFIILGGMTYASNPLYLLQCLLPLAALASWMILFKTWRALGTRLAVLVGITATAGQLLRLSLGQYIKATVGSYVDPMRTLDSLSKLLEIIMGSSDHISYLLLWVVWLAIYGFYFCYCLGKIRQRAWVAMPSAVLIHGFLMLAPPLIVLGVVVSGNFYTRYFLAIPIFLLLGISLAICDSWPGQKRIWFAATLLLFGTGFFAYQWFTFVANDSKYERDIQCVDHYSQSYKLVAIAGYWNARYLQLYSLGNYSIYQAHKDFHPYDWLSNIRDHQNSMINSVIVSKTGDQGFINLQDVKVLGEPFAIYSCTSFDIYRYEPASIGYQLLNERMRLR